MPVSIYAAIIIFVQRNIHARAAIFINNTIGIGQGCVSVQIHNISFRRGSNIHGFIT